MAVQAILGNRAVLETPLGEDRHVDAGDGFHSPGDNFTFERVETVDRRFRECVERDRFRDGDNIRPGKGAEALKAKVPGGSVRAGVAAAESAAIGERMFDAADAPALLVEHQITDDAADG